MDVLELVVLAVWSFAVALAGGVAGLVLGNLRLPVVVLLASSPAAAAGANVAISGISAVASAAVHGRGGRIDWRLFRWMAPASLAGAIAGGLISGVLPGRALLAIIGVVVLYGAVEILRHEGSRSPSEAADGRVLFLNATLIGFGVGLIGGVVGLILGSMRLPALVRWAGVTPYAAVGTNSAVGAVVGLGGLLGHLPSGVDWDLLAAGVAGGVPGALLGARLTGRLSERGLLRATAAVLVVSGLAMLVQAIAG